MKIHSDILTAENLRASVPSVNVYANVIACGSRKRARAFIVYLEFLGEKVKGDKRQRRVNGPMVAGGEDGPMVGTLTATYDEHGVWMARLFEIDPEAIIGNYDGRDDFIAQTEQIRASGWRKDASFLWLPCENCGGPEGYPSDHAVGCPLGKVTA